MIDSFLESLMFCQLWPSLKKLIFSRSHISAVSDEDRFKVRSRVAGDDGDDGDRRRHVNERRGAFLSGLVEERRWLEAPLFFSPSASAKYRRLLSSEGSVLSAGSPPKLAVGNTEATRRRRLCRCCVSNIDLIAPKMKKTTKKTTKRTEGATSTAVLAK